MISSLIALTLAAAVQDPAAAPRSAYHSCMARFLRQQLRADASESAFATAIATACPDQEAALKAALIRANVEQGDTPAEAEQFAAEEIDAFKENERERFATYKEFGTVPD